MKSKKIIAAALAIAMMVTSVQLPPVQVSAETTNTNELKKFEDRETLYNKAEANSWTVKTGNTNDGLASWAFDDPNLATWWHSKWADDNNSANNQNGVVKDATNSNDTNTNTVYIQTGFGQTWYVSGIEYTRRDGGLCQIADYEIYVATLDNPDDTVTDDDFGTTPIASGRLENGGSTDVFRIDWDPVEATHVRIVVKSSYGNTATNHVAAKNIDFYGYDTMPEIDKSALEQAIVAADEKN